MSYSNKNKFLLSRAEHIHAKETSKAPPFITKSASIPDTREQVVTAKKQKEKDEGLARTRTGVAGRR
jgi:hypothetical protein